MRVAFRTTRPSRLCVRATFSRGAATKNSLLNYTNRLLDKQHRQSYYGLDRELRRYGKQTIRLEPTIRDHFVQVHLEMRGGSVLLRIQHPLRGETKTNDKKQNNKQNNKHRHVQKLSKSNADLEPVVYYILSALRRPCANVDVTYLTHQREALNAYVSDVLQSGSFGDTLPLSDSVDIVDIRRQLEFTWETSFAAEARSLMEHYDIYECSAEDRHSLAQLVCLFYGLSYRDYDSEYTVDGHLVPWINSIYAENIVSACEWLTGLSRIPAFVVADVLLRTPLSKEDLYYQLDLWMEYIHVLSTYYYTKPSVVKRMFEEIIRSCIAFDSHKLPLLLSHSLSYFASSKTGYVFTFINPEYINRLLWLTALHTFKTDVGDSVSILKAHQILLRYISFKTDDSLQKHLTFEGNLGIVLGLRSVANSKAEQLLEAAEHRFQDVTTIRTVKAYQIVKLGISKTPEELVANFNSYGDVNSSDVWYAFIRKLSDFGMLNSSRSKSLLVELIKKSSSVLITKEILNMLVHTIDSIADLEFMTRELNKHKLDAHFKNLLLRKYVQVLYRNPNTVVKPHQLRYLNQCYLDNVQLQLRTHLEYARHIYASCFEYYPTSLIGVALNGEARVEPETFYDKYDKEVLGRRRRPDEACLTALITAAMNVSQTNVAWGDSMFPAQVAVHGFKSNVMTKWYDEQERGFTNDVKLYPSNRLWQTYIKLLAQFEYTPELSNMIEWWTELKFTPNETTLKWLLLALPSEYASLYILHMHKVRSDSQKHQHDVAAAASSTKEVVETVGDPVADMTVEDVSSWPWPTEEQLHEFKQINRI